MHVFAVKNALFFLVAISMLANAETYLTGKIGGKTLGPEGNPYIISENIVVEPNAHTVIKAGCILLFNSFSGMVVEGGLRVEGTLDNPVVFTTTNDSVYYKGGSTGANPFDWNGIFVTRNASQVVMSNFILAYSVYGIKSEKDEFRIQNGSFKANGQFHLTVRDVIKPVIENYPFTYGESFVDTTVAPEKSPGRSPNIVVPVVTGTIGIISGITCGVFLAKGFATQDEFKNEPDPAARKELESLGRSELTVAGVTGAAFIVCVPLAVYLLLKNKKADHAGINAPFTPVVTSGLSGTGIALNVNF